MNDRLSTMVAVPIKPQYGPTLGHLLAPRWHAASPLVRRTVIAAGLALVALVVGVVLTLENASFSHGGPVPFSFAYRGLYRVAPDPGGYVKVQRHRADGRLEDSYAVAPLHLPPYTGELSGELPLYATSFIARLSRRYPGFVLRGEGRTRVNGVFAYQVLFTAPVQGRTMFARAVLLLPERAGVRDGVEILMLTSPTANKQVEGPSEVAATGILLRPLKSFSFG